MEYIHWTRGGERKMVSYLVEEGSGCCCVVGDSCLVIKTQRETGESIFNVQVKLDLN